MTYRALFARDGARRSALSSAVCWLAYSGYGLAMLLAVQQATGSFRIAGSAVAAFSVGAAVLAPVRGRLVDRRGRAALRALAAIHGGVLVALAAGCALTLARGWLVAAAGLAGMTAPPLVAAGRRSWAQVAGPDLARTAHAANAALGDAAQLVGPALTVAAAASASPVVALVLLAVGVMVGALLLPSVPGTVVAQRSTAPPRTQLLRGNAGLLLLVVAAAGTGVWLGAFEVAAASLALSSGTILLAAAPMTAFSATSLAASLAAARLPGRPGTIYALATCALAGVLPGCLLVPTIVGLTVAAAVAGFAFGASTVAVFALLDEVVPPRSSIEAFTWLTSGEAAGLALGAALAGALADDDPRAALGLVAAAAVLVAALVVAGRNAITPSTRSPAPPAAPPDTDRPSNGGKPLEARGSRV